ncbi:M15 family metallopeptidase [Micromonospora echinofusca]|uniref:M15 family peptidase n=1 Tax=Micromonospora echinofusca TaxID=47858 RepID=A0ABS3VU98_MICEH|nr:M15 family metallopeptidase [Micromonospora echinofusca]MBO4208018.1 M15 family peptidase [Micromonospora echinofusca]
MRRRRSATRTPHPRPAAHRALTLSVVAVLLVALPACAGPRPAPSVPPFVHEIRPVGADEVSRSWRPGCPVGPGELRALRLGYWGFDGRSHVGTLVAHETVADDLVGIFAALYRERFPIRQMQPVDAFDGSDDRSMAADNTSGFNCRRAVAGGTQRWSAHAYGRAVDVNPVENPYLLKGAVLPPEGAGHLDRTADRPGMAVPDGTLVRAFTAAGWQWGGTWPDTPDYQHFSRPAR